MTSAPYAGLRAAARADALKPNAKDMMPEEDEAEAEEAEAEESEAKEKDKDYMNTDEANAAVAAARADERARCLAVISSEHFAGREAQATKLLAKDGLSADDVIELLADIAPAKAADPEAAAREEMRAAIEEAGISGVEANDSGAVEQDGSASVWDKTYAKLGLNKAAA